MLDRSQLAVVIEDVKKQIEARQARESFGRMVRARYLESDEAHELKEGVAA